MRNKKKLSPRLPLTHALGWIVASALVISGSANLFLKSYFKERQRMTRDPQYAIRSIVQTGPQKEALKTEYFAELLGISADHPPSSQNFDLKLAKTKLMQSPLISRAEVKLVNPQTLYIDYTIRQPIAKLYDYENVGIDWDGYSFPLRPFFSPKNLPEVYLGMGPFGRLSDDPERSLTGWGKPLEGRYIQLALAVLSIVNEPQVRELFHVKRIDVSDAFAESYGVREIVFVTEDTIIQSDKGKEIQFVFPKILRLSTKNYAQELGNYIKLREQLIEQERKAVRLPQEPVAYVRAKEKVIDFRIPNLAFVDDQKGKS